MSMNFTGKIKVKKTSTGHYFTSTTSKILNEAGETELDFAPITVAFKKGIEVDEGWINVINGFLTHYRTDKVVGEYTNKDGEVKESREFKNKLVILDFELLDGEEQTEDIVPTTEFTPITDDDLPF